MFVKALAVSSALFFLVGCVSATSEETLRSANACNAASPAAPAQSAPDEDGDVEERDPKAFAARAGGTNLVLLTVDGQYITGPGVSLGRYEEEEGLAIRGQIDGAIADLRVQGDGVRGSIDNNPVQLEVQRKGSSVDVAGLVPGRVSRFKIDEAGLRGNIGGCAYDLQRASSGFAGRRACGSSVSNFTLELPDTMASWTDADIAAVLVLFLRRG